MATLPVLVPSLSDFISDQHRGIKLLQTTTFLVSILFMPAAYMLRVWLRRFPIYLKPLTFLLAFPVLLVLSIIPIVASILIVLPLHLALSPILMFRFAQFLYYRSAYFQSRLQAKLDHLETLCQKVEPVDMNSFDLEKSKNMDEVTLLKFSFFHLIYEQLASKVHPDHKTSPFSLFFEKPRNMTPVTEDTEPKDLVKEMTFYNNLGDAPIKLNLCKPGVQNLLIDFIQLALDCDAFPRAKNERKNFQMLLEHLRGQESFIPMAVAAIPKELVPLDVANRMINEFLFGNDRSARNSPRHDSESERTERAPVGCCALGRVFNT